MVIRRERIGWWSVLVAVLLCGDVVGTGLGEGGSRAYAETASLSSTVASKKDLAYGDDPRQRMDVYLPSGVAHAPVIVMVHGGAWRLGDKENARVTENKIARWVPRGVVFVSVNYRLLPAADPLRQAQDVARALGFAQAHAAEWNADPAKCVLMGHSAGAHLVALLSADPAMAIREGARPWLGTVVLDSAALDVEQVMRRRHPRFYDAAFGSDPRYWRSASPMHSLSAAARPMLLACSTQRPDDPCGAARQLASEATRLKARAEVLPQALSHAEMNERVGEAGAYTKAIEVFLRSLDGSFASRLIDE